MVASSSTATVPAAPQGSQFLLLLAFEPPPLQPLSVDKFVTPYSVGGPCTPADPRGLIFVGADTNVSSSPRVLLREPTERSNHIFAGMDASDSSGEEFGSGDLDSSSDDAWQQTRLRHAEAWVSPGRAELSERLLFAFVEPPVPMMEVSFFLRSALRALAPRLPVDLLPSSRGAMLLRCESAVDRDLLHRLGPVSHEGHMLYLQKPEETSNRFFRVPAWLAFVAVTDFPNEHWYAEKIFQCFRSFSEVVEIDPDYLTGENFGSLRLLLEVNDRLEIPLYLRISSKLGVGRAGAVAKILPIRVWPRQSQLDSEGNLARFFGPPAPPSAGRCWDHPWDQCQARSSFTQRQTTST